VTITAATYAWLQRLPKAELHVHLDGSLRPETLHELAFARGVALPVADASALGDYMRVDDARNLEDYLARFEITLSVMQDVEALERIAHELVIDSAQDGVRYVEVRYCPWLNTRGGLSLDEVVEAVQRGLSRGERETGTVARTIICALRNLGAAHAKAMAEVAVSHRDRGVVAFDLAGGEAGNPARDYAEAFAFARAHDLAVTVHAGEGSGADSIREAVHLCGANRIGHGTRLLEDPSLMAYVRDRRIALEVCPTSNVQTRVAATFAAHPLKTQRESGVIITVNTDNRLMSGVTLTEEYARCMEHLGMDLADLASLSLAAFDAAFLPWPERRPLRDAAARDIAQWLDDAQQESIADENAGPGVAA
jgi:adenosine deaminase